MDVSIVGGTFVGGSSSGWEIVNPGANAAALGIVTQPVYGGGAAYSAPAATAMPVMNFGAPATAGAASYDPYVSTGFVGGSWSPEPLGNNQILYGHYSASGALALPQAAWGQAATKAAGGANPAAPTKPEATPKAAAKKTTAAKKSTAEKKADAKKDSAPKKVTVRKGDTLAEIAKDKGTTVAKLHAANKTVIGTNTKVVRAGQVLKIPK